MTDGFDDLRELLRRSSLGGHPSHTAPTPHATLVAGEAALSRILARRRPRRLGRLHWLGAGVVAAVAVAAVLLAMTLRPLDDETTRPVADAAVTGLPFGSTDQPADQLLSASALAAAGGGYAVGDPREWLSWDSTQDREPVLTSVLVQADGTVRVERRAGVALSQRGDLRDVLETVARQVPSVAYSVPPQPASSDSTDEIIRVLLLQDCVMRSAACALTAITDLATDPRASIMLPQSRLWERLRHLRDLRSLGSTTDRLGRQVAALAADSSDATQRIVVLIDTSTGRYLGTEYLARYGDGFTVRRFVVVV